MNEMTENEGKTEEEKLAEYAGQGLRGPRFGIFEQRVGKYQSVRF